MKKLIILVFTVIFLIPSLSADAQSKRKCTSNNSVGERIGNEIEKIVDQITQQWDLRDDGEQVHR